MLLVFSLQTSKACDACGCSISGGGIGLLSAYRYNYIGLQWYRSAFATIPGHGQGADDSFNTFELSFRYHLSDRLKVLINQPFEVNTREVEGQSRSLQGLSDTRIVVNYTLFKDVPIGKKAKLYAEIGTGLKLPFGKFDPDIHDTDLPENFNIGNGSLGYLFQSDLILSINKSGIVWSTNIQINDQTERGYSFGNQLSSQGLVFHEIQIKEKWSIIPNTGLYAEWLSSDQYANKNTVEGTGGNGVFFTTGLNVKRNKWVLGMTVSLPVSQNYSNKEVEAGNRFSCQTTYIF